MSTSFSRMDKASSRMGSGADAGAPMAAAAGTTAGATDAATGDHIDLLDAGRVQRKHALDADAVADLAHRERGAVAGARLLDDDALEGLGALLLAFLDEHRHLDGVAHFELRERHLLELALLQRFDDRYDVKPAYYGVLDALWRR